MKPIEKSTEELRELDRQLARRLEQGDAGGDAEDSKLDSRTRQMLRHLDQPPGFLEHSPVSHPEFSLGLAADLAETGQIGPGSLIGVFELEQAIGSGGMGVVYRARRVVGGFEQTVALKILAGTRPDGDTIRLFERERMLLARLEHPGIARLIDGGVTADGRPWFAMEYIEGVSIDRYCRNNRLGINQRLELFLQVCRALEYAHGRMVLHRDIKPNNLLVTAGGEVKLVDFGLGRLLANLDHQTPDRQANETIPSQGWLTPEYASPEQMRGETMDVRSEVYQLGLVLYRLLAGRSPHENTSKAPARLIREVEESRVRPPSRQWLGDQDRDLIRQRAREFRMSPEALRRRLRGDLDSIVATALRKEPAHRYGSVERLAGDLHRYQAGLPVTARGMNWRYRAGKFMRRQALSVGIALLAVATIAVATYFHIDQLSQSRDRAALEAEKARVVSEFLIELFETADPAASPEEQVSAMELIDKGAERVNELEDTPLMQAALLRVLSGVNQNLGRYETAAALRRREIEILARGEVDAARLAEAEMRLGLTLYELTHMDEAEAAYQRAQALLESARGNDRERASVLNAYGNLLRSTSRMEEAEARYRQALSLISGNDPDRDFEATVRNNLATVLAYTGDYQQAHDLFAQALEIRRQALGEDHPWTTIPLGNMAYMRSELGDLEGAEALYRQALEKRRDALGETHPRVAIQIHQIGRLRWRLGDHAGAERLWRQAIDIQTESLGADHPLIGVGEIYLGRALAQKGEIAEAEAMVEGALKTLRGAYGDEHRYVALGLHELGELQLLAGNPRAAQEAFVEALESRQVVLGESHRDVARTMSALARTHRNLNEPEQARIRGEQALVIFDRAYKNLDRADVKQTRALLAELDR